jgi:hypothetical protein
MEIEPTPQEYQHPTRIYLDRYQGVASNTMELNEQVADRFMSVSDIRKNIVITTSSPDRARDYDQLGHTLVGKRLQVPRFSARPKNMQVVNDEDAWFIEVNDQSLALQTMNTNTESRNFEDKFTEAFRNEVNNGLRTILKREKLVNGDEFSKPFIVSYGFFLMEAIISSQFMAISKDATDLTLNSLTALTICSGTNTMVNAFNYVITKTDNLLTSTRSPLEMNPVRQEDPFIRQTKKELPLPTIPIDRLARGVIYLHRHGDKLINSTEQ